MWTVNFSESPGSDMHVKDICLQGDKHLMSKELAIPYRDLRLLDPEVTLPHLPRSQSGRMLALSIC